MCETRTDRLEKLFSEWKQQRKKEAKLMCLDSIVCEKKAISSSRLDWAVNSLYFNILKVEGP